MTDDVVVERVPAVATYGLRQSVLRPHQPIEEVSFTEDEDASTAHFGAWVPGRRLLGVGSVLRQPPPWETVPASGAHPPLPPAPGTEEVPASAGWRLRGMAVADGARSIGVGGSILRAVDDYVLGHGGRLLWCNARVSALGFYTRAGLSSWGEAWEEPEIGPHVVCYRLLGEA